MLSEEDFALFTRWRVGAFGRKLREVCDDEAYDDMTLEDKIGMCIDAEIEARDSRKIDKAVRTARFKLKGACVEDIYYLPDRSITRDRIARLATCAWIGARENLVIISESGGGKSYIAQALGVAACRKLTSVRYARLNDMFRELNVARSEGRVYDALDRFAKPDLLILDDFFTTPIENPLNAVDLFEILEAREGRGSTMFASQLEPDQWYLRINSELCADSILSRAVEHARVLDIKGPNMREYTARERAFVQRALEVIPDNALVIYLPHDGSVFSSPVDGMNVYYKSCRPSEESLESEVIRARLNQIAPDCRVQQAVQETGARYVLLLGGVDQSAEDLYTPLATHHESMWSGLIITDDTPEFRCALADGELRLYELIG